MFLVFYQYTTNNYVARIGVCKTLDGKKVQGLSLTVVLFLKDAIYT